VILFSAVFMATWHTHTTEAGLCRIDVLNEEIAAAKEHCLELELRSVRLAMTIRPEHRLSNEEIAAAKEQCLKQKLSFIRLAMTIK
jgi:hypothetical protein